MTISDAIFTQLAARYAGDTGSGNLPSIVREFLRETDVVVNGDTAAIVVSLGAPRSIDQRPNSVWLMDIGMIVRSHRSSFAEQKAIADRILTVFGDWKPSAQDGWTFSPMTHVQEAQGEANAAVRMFNVVFRIAGFKTGDGNLLGFDGSFSGYAGGRAIEFSINRHIGLDDNMGFESTHAEFVATHQWADGSIKFYVTGVPPVPGQYGPVTFTLGTGAVMTFPLMWVRTVRTIVSLGTAMPQICEAVVVSEGVYGT